MKVNKKQHILSQKQKFFWKTVDRCSDARLKSHSILAVLKKKKTEKNKEYFREQTGTEVDPCCVQNWLCACKVKHNQWKHKVVDFLSRHSHLGFGFNIFTIKLFCCLKTNALLLWNHDLVKHVHGEYHTPSKGRKIFFFSTEGCFYLFIYFYNVQNPDLL